MAKRSSFGSIMRKKLSDITNSQTQPKLPSQDDKPPPDEAYIDQLLQERKALLKLISERNKTIELSAAELQKLRASLQKLQLQNWNLAQSNSQMLAELNFGRERIKTLGHALVCKDALLKMKDTELKRKTEVSYEKTASQRKTEVSYDGKTASQEGEVAAEQLLHEANNSGKKSNRNRRRTRRSRSMGPSTAFEKVADKEKVENKRRCMRRQSARFKFHEREPTENLFEIEYANYPLSQSLENPMHEGPLPLKSSIKKEAEVEIFVPRNEAQPPRRSSVGRPLRKAVEKVESYTEAPIKIKMRRTE
ncbi:hypothetical protein I3843_13G107600 [Carya illinoinensis]|uniref:Shugoshin C-terminal domain-containing protein n=1 Tax=Carya illinoinensis TaxID=32201 RepID=A0A8T1NSU6_CARIL|nr:shugoshin-1-like isoform X1 [Carya illinoinensis]KAG2674171.1 hypothetical protein I3760_13G122300 [Carya illinoinensis]KAG6631937.1 hypothetical protein CIPAW_13G123400 [Carya illinoinensis]KAG7950350.1 hypothetical protein I3843_13G107600 [Carya illinoinensis]